MAKPDDANPANEREDQAPVSRRKWLIDLGRAAAVAGLVGKTGASPAAQTVSATHESGAETLPPGLFRPSPEHLGHALVEDSRFHPVPPGCQVDFIRPRSGPFEPKFFSHDDYQVIRRLTALMLGESPPTSGQSDDKQEQNIVDEVSEWIDLRVFSFPGVREAAERLTSEQIALAEAYDGARFLERIKANDPQKTYRDGLVWIEAESKQKFQHVFIDLSVEQQSSILDSITDERAETAAASDGTRFFHLLKSDIISGFYTSKAGLKELDNKRNQFYAESPGCSSAGHRPPNRKR